MPFYGKKRTTSIPRKKRTYKKRSGGVKNLVAKMVKVQLHKAVENKLGALEFPITNFNSGATINSDCIRIMPAVANGTGDGQKTGNQITARKFSLKGHMNVIPQSLDSPRSRIMARMLVVIPKKFPTVDVASNNVLYWLGDVLKQGNSGSALDGTIKSMYLPVNREVVTCLADKTFYLNASYFNSGSSPQTNFSTQFATKLFSLNFKVKNKVIKYYDGAPDSSNYDPTLLFSYCFLDGSATSSLTTAMSMAFVSVLEYEDA